MDPARDQLVYYHLAVALAIGLMIGVERGWEEREAGEGHRIAGVRTYGLIGLLGGSAALLAGEVGAALLGFSFLGVAAAVTAAYVVDLMRGSEDVGITSLVAALLTFVLGALAALGQVALAAAAGVVVTLLLSYKRVLHGWIGALGAEELRAGLRLLLISVVLLPILPNRGYGPWGALNPYAIWSMVVLIAAISFVGYFAVRIAGARRGAVFTGIFGGLASSTAVTLHLSRAVRADPGLAPALAMGILLACGTMLPRILLVAFVVNPTLAMTLLPPAALMAALTYLPALVYWREPAQARPATASPLTNPLELGAALGFGLLLAAVLLLGRALREWFGNTGLLALAAASGIGDVDAITLSLARMSQAEIALGVAASGVLIAASVNGLTKAAIAAVVGGCRLGMRVGMPLAASAVAGMLYAWLRLA